MARGATSRRTRTARRAAGAQRRPDSITPESQREAQEALAAALELDPAASDWVRGVSAALTAAGEPAPENAGLVTTYELCHGGLDERAYYAEVIRAGYSVERMARWPSEATIGDHGDVLFSADDVRLSRLKDGTIVLASISHGWARFRVAAPNHEAASSALSAFNAAYPPMYRESTENASVVPITFWADSKWGPTSRLRMIDSAGWPDIDGNYAGDVRGELERLMSDEFDPGAEGQLLLWQGPPGTGKTWALRALASQWRPWAEFHYITDPDAFFVGNPSYMIDVLLADTYDELMISPTGDADVVTSVREDGKWRILILEDTGELLSANAKESYGQGLSRLLNVVDGMIGQGLRVLALITTNDELGDLHPAATRPGRCASQIVFAPLSADEATAWLGSEVDHDATLAELYQMRGDGEAPIADDPDGEFTDDSSVPGEEVVAEEQRPRADKPPVKPGPAPVSTDGTATTAAGEFAADEGACADCGDEKMQHEDGEGACMAEGCDCGTYAEPDASTTAAAVPGEEAILPAELEPHAELPPTTPGPDAPAAAPAMAASTKRWTATLCPEGVMTDDGRMFAPGSVHWRGEPGQTGSLPLTLMAMLETQQGHTGASVAGRIDRIWREGNLVRGEGVFDESAFGEEIARMVADGVLRGVSVDIAVREYEIVSRAEIDANDGELPEEGADEVDLMDLLFGEEDVVFLVTDGVIGAVTVCPFPAFADAEIALAASASPAVWKYRHQGGFQVTAVFDRPEDDEAIAAAAVAPVAIEGTLETLDGEPGPAIQEGPAVEGVEPIRSGLTAAAAGLVPVAPPAHWFDPPELEELTPLVVTPEGRVYGHIAAWDFCHIAIPDSCTIAPHSATEYAYFHLGEIECDNGERIACGKITLGTGHADPKLGRAATVAHYDHTGTAAVDCRGGEDEFGIWVAGALRPDVPAEDVRVLRASTPSGDWRNVNGNLELVAVLAVNVPGFPVPRPRALLAAADDGYRVLALTAAGLHDGRRLSELERDQIDRLARMARGGFQALVARARGEA